MVKLISRVGRNTSQYLFLAAMMGLLVGCGSGSSADTTPIGEQDADNDGIINSEDFDADGDDIDDLSDDFVDLDGDGRDDLSGYTELQAQDFDNDGIVNAEDPDADADGIEDSTDSFVDLDENGLDDTTGAADPNEVTLEKPCGGAPASGRDNNSSNNTWSDNCEVKRSTVGGQFADSLFSVGIQRVLFCSGYGDGDSVVNFADGEFAALSEAALKDFQRNEEGLTADGIVGPNTWSRLQQKIERLSLSDIGTREAWGFETGRCAEMPLFYQETQQGEGGDVLLGWLLARNFPNETETLPFSIESNFPTSKL